MSYFELTDLEALIPSAFLTQALDDDADGVIDAFEVVRTTAQNAVDALLESRFTVPFTTVPAKIKAAAVTFACAMCYRRRSVADADNPFAKLELAAIKKLETIEAGDLGMATTAAEPAQDAGSIVTWESELGRPGRLLG